MNNFILDKGNGLIKTTKNNKVTSP